ncbi:hypothetical protein WMY93_033053 [Mugilogobius chulae]|uniref:Uncharacterized protein n=1 Tax=Mugilogobius chulae TaxID=88201 RepID=A0AAW0MTY2_9GOBI
MKFVFESEPQREILTNSSRDSAFKAREHTFTSHTRAHLTYTHQYSTRRKQQPAKSQQKKLRLTELRLNSEPGNNALSSAQPRTALLPSIQRGTEDARKPVWRAPDAGVVENILKKLLVTPVFPNQGYVDPRGYTSPLLGNEAGEAGPEAERWEIGLNHCFYRVFYDRAALNICSENERNGRKDVHA